MVRIGQRAADAPQYSGDEVWIKGFKEGGTTIRPLQRVEDWHKYKQHYSQEAGFFPCLWPAPTDECVGCNDVSEQVRNRSNQYAFNALDKDGRVQVYRLGGRQYDVFKAREQRQAAQGGPDITACDWTIYRSGTGFSDTTYDSEKGDEYEIDLNGVELIDIAEVLGDQYVRVAELYGKEVPEEDSAPPARPAAKKAAAKAAPRKAEARPAKPAEPEPVATEAEATTNGEKPNFGVMETEEIAKWLDEHGIEYPSKATRARLIALGEGIGY